MKQTFLDKLHVNGTLYLIGALLLLVGVPLYQVLILLPQGYEEALTAESQAAFSSYLLWINNHLGQFLGYRLLLILALAILLNFPFTLFRIIVAQEILGYEQEDTETSEQSEVEDENTDTTDGMPAYAWRGKGFAVIAAWSGLLSIILYTVGTLASTTYLVVVSNNAAPPTNFATVASILSIIPNTIGVGLLATFGYTALAVAALLSGSAVAVASAPTTGQAVLTTPATLLFALWILWFGIMLVRLQAEA